MFEKRKGKVVEKNLTREQLREHAKQVSKEVSTWPKWKRTVLEGALKVVGDD